MKPTLSALALCIAASPAFTDTIRIVDVPANDIVYDLSRDRIYASIPSSFSNGNSIAVINPNTAQIESYVSVGPEPTELAISQDAQFLYVGLNGTGSVQRVELATLTAGLEFSLGEGLLGTMYAEDMVVLSGQPESVAISRRFSADYSPSHAGVAVYDNGVMRSNATPWHTGSTAIELSNDPMRLYGFDGHSNPGGFYRLAVDAGGVSVVDGTNDLISSSGVYRDIEFSAGDGRIYSAAGEVIDPEARLPVGTCAGVPVNSPVEPDSAVGRTFYLTQDYFSPTRLLAYDQTSFAPVGSMNIPNVYCACCYCGSLIRWGLDGLAFRYAGQVYLVRTCLVRCADLAISMTASPNPPQIGSNVTYTITILNQGPADAPAVQLVDTLDSGLEFVTGSVDCVSSGLKLTCELGTLPANVSMTLTLVASASLPGILVNRAEVSSALSDLNVSNNFAIVPQADVDNYSLFKGQIALQLDAGKPKPVPRASWVVLASVAGITNGSVVAATLSVSGGAPRPLQPDSVGVTFSLEESFSSRAALDAAYPATGSYTFLITGVNDGARIVELSLTNAVVPRVPRVNNWPATRAINFDRDFTLTWDALAGGTRADWVGVQIRDFSGNVVFTTPIPTQRGALDGTSTAATIPGNTMQPSFPYSAVVLFVKAPSVNLTDYPGASGIAGVFGVTSLRLQPAVAQPGAGTLQFCSAKVRALEEGREITITVVRTSGTAGTVSVDYTTVDSSAKAGQDYAAASGKLSYADGETSKSFTVDLFGDTLRESNKKFLIALSNPTGGAILGKVAKAAVLILDDD